MLFNSYLLSSCIFLLLFVSCIFNKSSSDNSPPEIKSASPEILSVRDTFVITFSEKIDTSAVNIKGVSEKVQYRFISQNKLEIFGRDSSSQIPHFPIQSEIEISLTGITDLDGNTQEKEQNIDLTFLPWYDNDAFIADFAFADTLRDPSALDNWKKGGAITSPMTSEGILQTSPILDLFDHKIIPMQPLDTLNITLDCPPSGNFGLTFYGPYSMDNFEGNKAAVEIPVKEGHAKFIQSARCKDKSKTVKLSSIVIDFENHTKEIQTAEELIYLIQINAIETTDFGFYQLTTEFSPRIR